MENTKNITRRTFAIGCAAAASSFLLERAGAQCHDSTGIDEFDRRQLEIDAVTPTDFNAYLTAGLTLSPETLTDYVTKWPALGRLEDAFSKVLREVKETVVTDGNRPAIWYVYNMGLIIKTPQTLLSIDLNHRRAEEFAPLLNAALITHNHKDHYTERFKVAMDRGQHKTVVNNFFDNYGAPRKDGGYTRAKSKTFKFGDATVITGLCDHNDYLIDYTSPFEVQVGDFTLYHSGDCCNHAKLHVSRRPDVWVFHPRCGMNPVKGCQEAVRPKLAVIAHLQEMGHAKGRYRWTYRDGLNIKANIEAAGFAAIMPLWGERIV